MSEQWHDAKVFIDDGAELVEIDHAHPEDPNDCDLSLHLGTTDGDELFALAPGYYRLRMDDGELVIEPADVTVIDLAATS